MKLSKRDKEVIAWAEKTINSEPDDGRDGRENAWTTVHKFCCCFKYYDECDAEEQSGIEHVILFIDRLARKARVK